MEGVLLQDWITIRAQTEGTGVIQGSSGWVDIGDMEDLVFFLEVAEVAYAPNMLYQTSPTKQDGSFITLIPKFPVVAGQRVDRVFTSMAAIPPARYVRWQLLRGSGPWDVTFRIWLGGYAWGKA